MITATFTLYDEIKHPKLVVKGHAGADVKGKDIVCASASILLYTLAQVVQNMEEQGDLAVEPVIVTEDGDAHISCICKTDESYEETVSAFKVVRTGFDLLAQNYPQYVELITDGEDI